jgi:hypothetical protein
MFLPLAHRLVPRLIHGFLVLLTNLRHGLASGLFAGAILVSAMGSPVGLRVLHGWLDRGPVSRLKAPIEAPGSSRVGCPMQHPL